MHLLYVYSGNEVVYENTTARSPRPQQSISQKLLSPHSTTTTHPTHTPTTDHPTLHITDYPSHDPISTHPTLTDEIHAALDDDSHNDNDNNAETGGQEGVETLKNKKISGSGPESEPLISIPQENIIQAEIVVSREILPPLSCIHEYERDIEALYTLRNIHNNILYMYGVTLKPLAIVLERMDGCLYDFITSASWKVSPSLTCILLVYVQYMCICTIHVYYIHILISIYSLSIKCMYSNFICT